MVGEESSKTKRCLSYPLTPSSKVFFFSSRVVMVRCPLADLVTWLCVRAVNGFLFWFVNPCTYYQRRLIVRNFFGAMLGPCNSHASLASSLCNSITVPLCSAHTVRGGGGRVQLLVCRSAQGHGGFGMTPWCDDLVCRAMGGGPSFCFSHGSFGAGRKKKKIVGATG